MIAELTPCFMMSPDSVARFLEPGNLTFDLVIFDEASQIRVAESVGAMGRAKAVVVAGDSKQMPPSSFGLSSVADDEDEPQDLANWVPEDQESILSECVDAQVPRTWLSWHYRSQDEALIAFSNMRYYESRLSSFPTPVGGGGGTGLQLVRVNGTFDRVKGPTHRTNRLEAEAIVAEIARRVNDPVDRKYSIGVVTFNIPQQSLIAQLLDTHPDPAVTQAWQSDSPDKIFVKNLESVQGDERDIIMFSLAFSPNESGNVPLNWGPLIQVGGERRLNVAITRARRLVMIFALFSPDSCMPRTPPTPGFATCVPTSNCTGRSHHGCPQGPRC